MESLSGNQVKDLKELYASIYKSDDQEISETTANLQGLDKKNLEAMKGDKKDLTKEKKDKKIEDEGEEKKPITINLPNGGTTKIYPASPNYEKAKNKENFTIDSSGERGKIDVKKNDSGELKGKLNIKTGSGDSVEKIEKDTKADLEKNKNKVKEKPLLSTKLPDTTKLGSTVKPVKPGSARDKMIAKNELRHGVDHVSNLRNKDADFQRMRSGEISKMDFMKQYPKSQTTKKYNLKQIKLGKPIIKSQYEPYDLVLDYVLSEGHAETVEEAHYVMTQMDADTIKTIVEQEQGVFKSNVLNKKYDKQPEMTEKGKKTLPKLNDPIINGKNYNQTFGISAGSQKALDMLKN